MTSAYLPRSPSPLFILCSTSPLLYLSCYRFLLKSILTNSQCRHVLTGSYHNFFRIFDTDSSNDVVLQADKSAFKAKKIGVPPGKNGLKNGPRPGGLRDAMQTDTLDFNKKILHASWHPRENTIAVSIVPCLGFGLCTDPLISDCCDKQLVLIQRSIISLYPSLRQEKASSSVQAPETPFYARTLSYTTLPYYRVHSFFYLAYDTTRYHAQLRITLFVFSGLVLHPSAPSPFLRFPRTTHIPLTRTYIMTTTEKIRVE